MPRRLTVVTIALATLSAAAQAPRPFDIDLDLREACGMTQVDSISLSPRFIRSSASPC